ncbi:MAG: thioesterase family protein [Candidatus Omnitrophota bacterium]
MFTYRATVKLHDTDAAGILFFANQFKIVHDAFEMFFDSIGFEIASMIRANKVLLVIVHAEADYHAPLIVGETLDVYVAVKNIGQSSFTLDYQIFTKNKKLAGTAKTVHVSLDGKKRKKIPLPEKLKTTLKKFSLK